MPKRGQRTISYNLSQANARAAFEEGIEHGEFELFDDDEPIRGGPSRGQQRLNLRNARSQRDSPFDQAPSTYGSGLLGEEQRLMQGWATPKATADMLALLELFGTKIERSVIEDAYACCAHSFEPTLQALMDVAACADAAEAQQQQQQQQQQQAQTASPSPCKPPAHAPQGGPIATAAAAPAAAPAAAAAAAAAHAAPSATDDASYQAWGEGCFESGAAAEEKPNLWELLHESMKEAVLSHLTAKELAAVAWTCRDFAWRVKVNRDYLRTLVIPAGISLLGVVGMVAGHKNAHAVSLVRWGSSGLKGRDFTALITAISQGSCSERRAVRVEALSLRGWTQSVTDGHVLTLLEILQNLRELDLSDCASITDAALTPISRYRRSVTSSKTTAATAPGVGTGGGSFSAIGAAAPFTPTPQQQQQQRIPECAQPEMMVGTSSREQAAMQQAVIESLVTARAQQDAAASADAASADAADADANGRKEGAIAGVGGLDSEGFRPMFGSPPASLGSYMRTESGGIAETPVSGGVGDDGYADFDAARVYEKPSGGSGAWSFAEALVKAASAGGSSGGGRSRRRHMSSGNGQARGDSKPATPGGSLGALGRERGDSKSATPGGSLGALGLERMGKEGTGQGLFGHLFWEDQEGGQQGEERVEQGEGGKGGGNDVDDDEEDDELVVLDEEIEAREAKAKAKQQQQQGGKVGTSGSAAAHNSSGRPPLTPKTSPLPLQGYGSSPGTHMVGSGRSTRVCDIPSSSSNVHGRGFSPRPPTPTTPGATLNGWGTGESPSTSAYGTSPTLGTSPTAYGSSPTQLSRSFGTLGLWSERKGGAPCSSFGKLPQPSPPLPGPQPPLPAAAHASQSGADGQSGAEAGAAGRAGNGAAGAGQVGTPGVGGVSSSNPHMAMASAAVAAGLIPGLESSEGGLGLQVLVLAGCSRISADGIRTFLDYPRVKQSLLFLDVSRCIRITRAALVLPPTSSLRVLKATRCANLHEVMMPLARNSPLQELWLTDCKALTKLHLAAPSLKLLHIGGCKALRQIYLRTPKLSHLMANLLFSLQDLDPADLHCPRLSRLNLFGCRHIKTESLLALLNQAHSLKEINVNGCNALAQIDLTAHEELELLDMSGCKGLTDVRISSARLVHAIARACPRLARLDLESRHLRSVEVSHCTSMVELSLPALAPAAAALVSGGYAAEAAHGVVVHGLRGPMENVQAANAVAAAMAPAALAQLRADGVAVPTVVKFAGCEGLPFGTVLKLRVLKQAASQHAEQQGQR